MFIDLMKFNFSLSLEKQIPVKMWDCTRDGEVCPFLVPLFSTNSSFYSIFQYIWIELSHQLDLLKDFNYDLLEKCQVSLTIVLARTLGIVSLFYMKT